jgi:hypothetical protein
LLSSYNICNIVTAKKNNESNNKILYQKKIIKKKLDNVEVYKGGKTIKERGWDNIIEEKKKHNTLLFCVFLCMRALPVSLCVSMETEIRVSSDMRKNGKWDLGFWGRNECEWMRIILRELLSLWMDDITHYNLNEMSDYDAWNLSSWTEIGPAPPSKQYILSKTKQVKYSFACFFFSIYFFNVVSIKLFSPIEGLIFNFA